MPCAASPHGQPPQRSSREPSAGERPRNKKKQRNGFARDPQARFAHAAQNPQGDLQDTENPSREHPLCGPSGRRCGAVRHRTGPRAQGGSDDIPGDAAGALRRCGALGAAKAQGPRNARNNPETQRGPQGATSPCGPLPTSSMRAAGAAMPPRAQ